MTSLQIHGRRGRVGASRAPLSIPPPPPWLPHCFKEPFCLFFWVMGSKRQAQQKSSLTLTKLVWNSPKKFRSKICGVCFLARIAISRLISRETETKCCQVRHQSLDKKDTDLCSANSYVAITQLNSEKKQKKQQLSYLCFCQQLLFGGVLFVTVSKAE